ncbi:MAG: NAD-dependent deacylase [Ignavibacteriales bacterium]|nr:NAD-dependent protein deacylase [Ignavibacteriaceae bacterium]MCZ2143360.1 NAD-dependent deacylase [Ignavibacteriales bacterium]WKZ72315.1 MAG: NAD-dependent deacylase [Ignavibacteriaceae bacterium]
MITEAAVIPGELIDKLADSRKIVFFTGSGVSAESGIPTFRGDDGLWKKFSAQELANFDSFMRNPDMVWEWYQYRRRIIHDSEPNAGHRAIVDFEKYFDVTVITQNVDDLHHRAGSSHVLELHGNITRNKCTQCGEIFTGEVRLEDRKPPRCACGALIRPDVVWFGENLPEGVYEKAEESCEACDMMFVVGTSGVVYPAALLPSAALSSGAIVVDVNIDEEDHQHNRRFFLKGRSGDVLPALFERVKILKEY